MQSLVGPGKAPRKLAGENPSSRSRNPVRKLRARTVDLSAARARWRQGHSRFRRPCHQCAACLCGLRFYLYSVQYHDTWVRTCMLSTLLVDSPTTRTERRAMQMSQTATPSPLGSENPATDKLTISTAARLKYGTRFNPLGSSCHHSPFCARARAQSGAGRMI